MRNTRAINTGLKPPPKLLTQKSNECTLEFCGAILSAPSNSLYYRCLSLFWLSLFCTSDIYARISEVLIEKIKELLSHIDLDNLNYNDNKPDIHRVLTLFNIITAMNSNGMMHRYPFRLHKHQECWSLEHIHAQKSEGLNTVKEWRTWLEVHNEVLKDSKIVSWQELSKQIEEVLLCEDKLITKDIYDSFFGTVKKEMSKENDIDEVHGIENMALLSKDDNSALNNFMFAVKRRKILEMDKNGAYIPICTRNVFLKYYNKDATDYVFWDPKDRDTYLETIKEVLCDYLPQAINHSIKQ